jgi:hypothetical protein
MKKIIALTVVLFGSLAVSASAGEAVTSSKEVVAPPPPPPTSYFRSNEFSLGVFGSYGVGFYDNHRAIGNHAWGGGIDGQYFPLQYLGFAVEGDFFNEIPHDRFGQTVTGNVILRLPLDNYFPTVHLAPYVFGGVGGIFNEDNSNNSFTHVTPFGFGRHGRGSDDDVLGDAGGGLEYRFTPHIGLFTDVRYNWVDGPRNDYMLTRFGLRYAF